MICRLSSRILFLRQPNHKWQVANTIVSIVFVRPQYKAIPVFAKACYSVTWITKCGCYTKTLECVFTLVLLDLVKTNWCVCPLFAVWRLLYEPQCKVHSTHVKRDPLKRWVSVWLKYKLLRNPSLLTVPSRVSLHTALASSCRCCCDLKWTKTLN